MAAAGALTGTALLAAAGALLIVALTCIAAFRAFIGRGTAGLLSVAATGLCSVVAGVLVTPGLDLVDLALALVAMAMVYGAHRMPGYARGGRRTRSAEGLFIAAIMVAVAGQLLVGGLSLVLWRLWVMLGLTPDVSLTIPGTLAAAVGIGLLVTLTFGWAWLRQVRRRNTAHLAQARAGQRRP